MNQGNHLQRLTRELIRLDEWFNMAPDGTAIREELRQYRETLRNNYHAITGRKWQYEQENTYISNSTADGGSLQDTLK